MFLHLKNENGERERDRESYYGNVEVKPDESINSPANPIAKGSKWEE